MKERPVIFNGDMVRAILDGRKTQTRRAVNFPIVCRDLGVSLRFISAGDAVRMADYCPYGKPGDRLWVRESAVVLSKGTIGLREAVIRYCADDKVACVPYPARLAPIPIGKRLSNGTYYEASRITLEITGVRVERLQDISDEDARAEGCTHTGIGRHIAADEIETAREQFERLWQSIYGEDSWNDNQWVWVIEFRLFTAGNKMCLNN